jgi:hypothetical protein
MTIYSLYNVILPLFRRKRFQRFTKTFQPTNHMTILDVGGYPGNWSRETCPAQITILNLSFHGPYAGPFRLVTGNGCEMQFGDKSFDIGHSNSVIEHLHTFENQQKFAAEIRRVSRRLWVQTPARCFIIEPHLITPMIHYLPKSMQRYLLRYFTIWGLLTKPSKQQVQEFLSEVRLLNYREMQHLFPDCHIHRERFFGLTKAYVAIR